MSYPLLFFIKFKKEIQSIMDIDQLFSAANLLAMLGWALLILVPRWKYTRILVQGAVIPILLSGLYLFLLVRHYGEMGEGGFGSLDELAILFSNKNLIFLGWVHYLAFDLWLGTWEYNDAMRHGIHRLVLLPCQLLTFFAGPVGLFLYITIRNIKTQKFDHENFDYSPG